MPSQVSACGREGSCEPGRVIGLTWHTWLSCLEGRPQNAACSQTVVTSIHKRSYLGIIADCPIHISIWNQKRCRQQVTLDFRWKRPFIVSSLSFSKRRWQVSVLQCRSLKPSWAKCRLDGFQPWGYWEGEEICLFGLTASVTQTLHSLTQHQGQGAIQPILLWTVSRHFPGKEKT